MCGWHDSWQKNAPEKAQGKEQEGPLTVLMVFS